jgi:hypothetical protein
MDEVLKSLFWLRARRVELSEILAPRIFHKLNFDQVAAWN